MRHEVTPHETMTVNAREYRVPRRPTVVITIDGCDPSYLEDAFARGLMPRLAASPISSA